MKYAVVLLLGIILSAAVISFKFEKLIAEAGVRNPIITAIQLSK
jgi:hypothetical protein